MGRDVANPRPRRAAEWSRRLKATTDSSPKFVPLANLRKLRECQQVAAVCYRVRNDSVEFLLVRTRGGRWIFPKGNAEPGLTHAQAAALEAFEEAGVHGRIEEACFSRYSRRKEPSERASQKTVTVNAHLCEVSRLESPQESGRTPTWFPAEKTKRLLREDRSPEYGSELVRVLSRALTRIELSRNERLTSEKSRNERSQSASHVAADALKNVQFIDAVPRSNGSVGRLRAALP
jgi:8-oxo-dGTP pyrophosphatase MutT (NUDIX family)